MAEGETLWESCRIAYSNMWRADVFTPAGSYSIFDARGRLISRRGGWPNGADRATVASHAAVIERLAREGWEPLRVGEDWWQREFRREARPREWEFCEIAVTAVDPVRLIADAIGHNGQYIAKASDRLKGLREVRISASAEDALPNFIADLHSSGWEFVGNYGSRLWEQRWRRRQEERAS